MISVMELRLIDIPGLFDRWTITITKQWIKKLYEKEDRPVTSFKATHTHSIWCVRPLLPSPRRVSHSLEQIVMRAEDALTHSHHFLIHVFAVHSINPTQFKSLINMRTSYFPSVSKETWNDIKKEGVIFTRSLIAI